VKAGKMTVDMESEIPGQDIFYTIDIRMPNLYSPKYSKPVELPDGPVTVRVVIYRSGKQKGHLITLTPQELIKRQTKN
jgi:hexosaminidase